VKSMALCQVAYDECLMDLVFLNFMRGTSQNDSIEAG